MDTSSRTVRAVDDEPEVLHVIALALRRAGVQVLTAGSGPEAERVCESHTGPIDAVVMDIILENETGIDAFPWLSWLRPAMKVLYISGYPGHLLYEDRGIRAPFLSKPFTPQELVDAVNEILAPLPVPHAEGVRLSDGKDR